MYKNSFLKVCLFSLGSLILAGCTDKTPTCDSDEAKKLVVNVAQNLEAQISSYIFTEYDRDAFKQCKDKVPFTSPQYSNNFMECRAAERAEFAKVTPVFSLSNIVLQAKNDDVHSVACTATLRGEVAGWGGGEMVIRYKLQRNTEGALVTTVSSM